MTSTNDFLKSLHDTVYATAMAAIAAAVKDSAPIIAAALGAKGEGFTASTQTAKPGRAKLTAKSKSTAAKKPVKTKAAPKQLTMAETALIDYVKSNAGTAGLNIEQIAKGLGMKTKDLKSAKAAALAGGSIVVVGGEARGTKYGIRGSVKASEPDQVDDAVESEDNEEDIPGTGEENDRKVELEVDEAN